MVEGVMIMGMMVEGVMIMWVMAVVVASHNTEGISSISIVIDY